MNYLTWRCTFQSAEQAALSAYDDVERQYVKNQELRQRIEFLELQVQGYRQNCERLERRIAEMGVSQRDEPKSCGSCTHFEKGVEFGSPCHQCFNYCNWEPAE